ncbi:MAG: hypothetical protein NZ484_01770 [Patescibacteria group bacterium]|nr:hypothetical protein [Patescibacteria group bacterium]MCX7589463.1 hypothetical protein [Patescibacteria group bacterium]MDW8279953.1 hypothetical protein [bacterium]
MIEKIKFKFPEDEIDAMDVTSDWPLSKGEWICNETGEHARVNPKDNSIIGCLSCNFRTRFPEKTGHFKIKKILEDK